MAIISVKYDEPKVSTYKHVELRYNKGGNKIVKLFDSGNFIVDWYNLNKWIAQNQENELHDEYYYSTSSSKDHFIMDAKMYISKYLKLDNDNKPYLTSHYDYLNEGVEFFIPKDEDWTWEQLKEYVNKNS